MIDNTICLDKNYSTTRVVTQEKLQILNNPEDKLETVLFLPKGENRKEEGGLRTKEYFKKSFDNKPLISVITVVYNGKEFLEETIQSVINQTYDNVEYIIIDGGSIDGTIDIIKKYEDRIDYWISEKDSGIYDAMNKGINLSTGQWINFMNAGDNFKENDVLVKIFLQQNICSYDLIYGSSVVIGDFKEILLKPKKFTKYNLYFWNTRVVCHQSVFVKETVILEYSLKYKLKSELNWYFDLINKVKSYKIVDFPIVLYSLGGAGDINYKLNTIESLKVVFSRNVILGCLSLPIILFKYIKKVFK